MLLFKSGLQKFIFGSPERNPALNPSLLKLSDCKVCQAKRTGLSDALKPDTLLPNRLQMVPAIALADKPPGLVLLFFQPLHLGIACPRLEVTAAFPRQAG